MKYTINVVTRLQDNGDGGYTLYLYNNNDELIADHPSSQKWDSETRSYKNIKLSESQINDILNEDDPYENGYIGEDSIEIEVDENGRATIKSGTSFHAGQ
jgi:hypothetical protein